MALAYLEHYRKAVLKAVENGSVHEIVPHGGHGPIREILGSTLAGPGSMGRRPVP